MLEDAGDRVLWTFDPDVKFYWIRHPSTHPWGLTMRLATVLPCSVVLLAGCTAPPALDLEAERNALMNADRSWYEAYSVSQDPVQAFADKVVDDAVLLPPDAPIAEGKDAIRSAIAGLVAMPGFTVSWMPAAADVGSGGDLGYTRGTYEMSFDGPDEPVHIVGKYLTVWKKQADGTWMVVADMFNADAPMAPTM